MLSHDRSDQKRDDRHDGHAAQRDQLELMHEGGEPGMVGPARRPRDGDRHLSDEAESRNEVAGALQPGLGALRAGGYEAAIAAADRAIAANPNVGSAYAKKANSLRLLGRVAQAIEVARAGQDR